MRVLVASLILLLAVQVQALALCTLDGENFPYAGNGDKNGMFDDFIDSMNVQSNLDIKIDRMPWKRCLRDVELGAYDGALALIHTPARDNVFAYPKTSDNKLDRSKRLWTVDYPVFVHQDSQLEWDGQKFNQTDILLSAPLGFVAYDKLKTLGVLFTAKLEKEKGFELLVKNRLDGYVVERSIGETLLQKLQFTDQIKVLEKPFLSSDWYMVLSNNYVKNNPEKAQQFWQLLENVRNDHGDRLYRLHMSTEID